MYFHSGSDQKKVKKERYIHLLLCDTTDITVGTLTIFFEDFLRTGQPNSKEKWYNIEMNKILGIPCLSLIALFQELNYFKSSSPISPKVNIFHFFFPDPNPSTFLPSFT